MNAEIERVGAELQLRIADLINHAQEAREVPEDTFQKVNQLSRELARLLKGSEMLPRKIFKDLYSAGRILIAQAPHTNNPDRIQAMGAELSMTTDLIVWGQCHEDRKPGVPRIR